MHLNCGEKYKPYLTVIRNTSQPKSCGFRIKESSVDFQDQAIKGEFLKYFDLGCRWFYTANVSDQTNAHGKEGIIHEPWR